MVENESTIEPTFVRKNKATFGQVKDSIDDNSFVLPSISAENRHSILDATFNVVPNVS